MEHLPPGQWIDPSDPFYDSECDACHNDAPAGARMYHVTDAAGCACSDVCACALAGWGILCVDCHGEDLTVEPDGESLRCACGIVSSFDDAVEAWRAEDRYIDIREG